ncbi:hypothetical protein CHS0354_030830 [Potamilus streckersoni]|uniref:Uncharacterized protein n=1 Tax=Potamilus streckersoni TaxID=2493646 RepID=A0AAE0WAR1_9BIVA|nr:hypothetical protein CHS0354_030830 [Potamilus streckersoni]
MQCVKRSCKIPLLRSGEGTYQLTSCVKGACSLCEIQSLSRKSEEGKRKPSFSLNRKSLEEKGRGKVIQKERREGT